MDSGNVKMMNVGELVGENFVIPVSVSGVKTLAVVDTAAQFTSVNKRFYSKLQGVPGFCETLKLMLAGKNAFMMGHRVENLSIEIDGIEYKENVYVADLQEGIDMLLGLKFLKERNCVVNLVDQTLIIGERCVKGSIEVEGDSDLSKVNGETEAKSDEKCVDELEREVEICENMVRTKKRIVVPPLTVMRISVCADYELEKKKEYVIEPCVDRQVLVSCALVKGDDVVPIEIVNDGERNAVLKAGSVLGVIKEVETVASEVRCKEYVDGKARVSAVNEAEMKLKIDENMDKEEVMRSLKRDLPEHLQDLFERSSEELDSNEMVALCETLRDYEDVFAKHDLDLGCMKGVKHTINTGSAAPVKQKLRRTPLGMEGEERKMLEKLLASDVIQPSNSEWASPPVLIRKKDGSVR
ncbi:uncharacterized protein LOC106170829, partial [Lingula anatina]|uniref:Uncharacterized protein LOC106170829 n=1 Tax=Lingula anatina TaxID=7574 RepID=A0A1S3J7J4_LINAN